MTRKYAHYKGSSITTINSKGRQASVLVDLDMEHLLKDKILYDFSKKSFNVMFYKDGGKRRANLSNVVLCIQRMREDGIEVKSLEQVLIALWGNDYNIGDAHHRLPKGDNRTISLQDVGKKKHKNFPQNFTFEELYSMDMERHIGMDLGQYIKNYIDITEEHCCTCPATECDTMDREKSFPQCRFNCKHWNSKL